MEILSIFGAFFLLKVLVKSVWPRPGVIFCWFFDEIVWFLRHFNYFLTKTCSFLKRKIFFLVCFAQLFSGTVCVAQIRCSSDKIDQILWKLVNFFERFLLKLNNFVEQHEEFPLERAILIPVRSFEFGVFRLFFCEIV